VLRDGVDGALVPAGDAAALGDTIHALALDPARRERMAAAARERAGRFAWPTVTGEVVETYEEAIERAAAPAGRVASVALRTGLRPESAWQPWRSSASGSSRSSKRWLRPRRGGCWSALR